MMYAPLPPYVNKFARETVDAVFSVHTNLGPGLLESVYEACLMHELARRGLHVERQVPFPVVYDTVRLDCGFRVDVIVEGKIILELKSVDAIHPIHSAQLLTYLKLADLRLGFLINFNVARIRDGIKRMIR